MNKIEEKEYLSMLLVYKEFYEEPLKEDNTDVIDKLNALIYILSNKCRVNVPSDYYVVYLMEGKKLYSPSLVDLVHKYLGKSKEDDSLQLSNRTLVSIQFLKDCIKPYLELHNDKTRAMNDLSSIIYFKECNPCVDLEKVVKSAYLDCTPFEISCISNVMSQLDRFDEISVKTKVYCK